MVPALISVAPALVAAAPSVITGVSQLFSANIAARVAYESFIHSGDTQVVAAIEALSSKLTAGTEDDIATLLQNLKDVVRAANVRMSGETEIWMSEDFSNSFRTIAEAAQNLESLLTVLKEVGGLPVRKNVAEVLDEKEFGVRDSQLHINVIPPDHRDEYQESWSMYNT